MPGSESTTVDFKVGDQVKYWRRDKGKKAYLVYGRILQISQDGTLARVKNIADHPVPNQVIEVKRLKRATDPD